MPKFFLVAIVGLVLNTRDHGALDRDLQAALSAESDTATGSVLVWNFTANRYWTFK